MKPKRSVVELTGVYGAELARQWRDGVKLGCHPMVLAEWITNAYDWNSYKAGESRYISLAVPARNYYAARDWLRKMARVRTWGVVWRGGNRWTVRVAQMETDTSNILTVTASCPTAPLIQIASAVNVFLATVSREGWVVECNQDYGEIYVEMEISPSNVSLASALWGNNA